MQDSRGHHASLGDDEDGEAEEGVLAGEEHDEEEMEEESDDEDYNRSNFGISQALPVPDGPPPDLSAGAGLDLPFMVWAQVGLHASATARAVQVLVRGSKLPCGSDPSSTCLVTF